MVEGQTVSGVADSQDNRLPSPDEEAFSTIISDVYDSYYGGLTDRAMARQVTALGGFVHLLRLQSNNVSVMATQRLFARVLDLLVCHAGDNRHDHHGQAVQFDAFAQYLDDLPFADLSSIRASLEAVYEEFPVSAAKSFLVEAVIIMMRRKD